MRFGELDPYGHVNHAVYLTYLEVARTELLAAHGLGLDVLLADGVQLVVVEAQVRYRAAAVAGDRLTVETWVDEVRRASSRWRQVIRRGDVVVVDATLRAAATDRDGRPVPPPPRLAALLAELTRSDGAGPA